MCNEQYLLGVIVPTYNQDRYLRETLDSLLHQSFQNLQIVVVNDGSTDETQNILMEYNNIDKLKVVNNEFNSGESSAVNLGWKMINASFVSIISSDDPQVPEWAAQILNFAEEHPGYVTYYPNLRIIDSSSKEVALVEKPEWRRGDTFERLNCVFSAGSIHNRGLLPNNFVPRNDDVVYPSDLIQALNLALHGDFKKVPNCLGTWRTHESGLTSLLPNQNKALQLNFAVKNWYLKNQKFLTGVRHNRMLANLYGQTWKLLRKDFPVLKSVFTIMGFTGKTYFLQPNNLFCILLAVIQHQIHKSRK
jgi:glycosyltransferase involved in cell wall biosynthesis